MCYLKLSVYCLYHQIFITVNLTYVAFSWTFLLDFSLLHKDDVGAINQTMAIIDFFFVSITLVGLLLCFFSLVASMISNIHEQSQDIAILRSMVSIKKKKIDFCL